MMAQNNSNSKLAYIGADVSSLQRALELGAEYCTEDGSKADPLKILQDHGVNALRLRVWVTPGNGASSPAKVTQFIPRLRAYGFKLLLNFHYSDTWADPGKQIKPAAWANADFKELLQLVYEHTRSVLGDLKAAGTVPEMVQVGNEINPGMLLPEGSRENWPQLAALLKKGCEAVKANSPETQVMLHIANAGDQAGALDWFDNAKAQGVRWDLTGLSYYSYWHGPIAAMTATVREMRRRYGKDVVIAETAYPFTLQDQDGEKNSVFELGQLPAEFPPTPAGQAENLRAVLQAARSAGAVGVFYWEPTWTAVKGNGWDPGDAASGCQWENQALFDFNGKALPAMSALNPEGRSE
jgi:arabinogalactan endo-1,4-beta-galactosidase